MTIKDIKHLYYWLMTKPSGLQPTPKDDRDFNLGIFGLTSYTPKKQRQEIKTISVKNQRDMNTCFPADAKILTEDFSYLRIKDVRIGDVVFSHKGKKQKVLKTMKRIWQGNMHSIKMWGDFREIEATPEHPILSLKNNDTRIKQEKTIEDGEIEFNEIKNLTKDDWVALPFNNIVEDKTIYSYEKDPDFLWLLGLYIAEGSASTDQICFSLHRKEINFYERIKSIMEKYGVNAKYSFIGDNGLKVYFTSKKWKTVFEELGGKYCDKKCLDERLMSLDPELQMNIFNGVYDGDGYLHPDGYKIIHMTSYKLLEQLKTILLRNKKYSLFREHTEVIGKKKSWSLSLSEKNKYYRIKNDYLLVKIKTVSKKISYESGYVYNIEVENDNSYQVNGIAVHNCQWNATIAAKEIDEKIELSVRGLVCYAKSKGYLSGDGFSSLRDGEKALKEWGAPEASFIPELGDWYIYSSLDYNKYTDNANIHKTQSYWSVNGKDEILKLLDDERPVKTGLMWYTGFNMSGGFSAPWIIEKNVGMQVGGHAIFIKGYDLNYCGRKVYICQNSYGNGWGDNGNFYIEMGYMDKNNYGFYVNLDIPTGTAKFLNDYDGKNVKGNASTIYFIQKGVKKAYPDWVTYLAFNGLTKGFSTVDDNTLEEVPDGDKMDISKSNYWDFLKELKAPDNLNKLIELLHKQ